MHPAYSVIVFTTASGAGYGLLFWLLAGAVAGVFAPNVPMGLAGFAIGLLLVTGGLVSSTAHLGRPERAWRAFSQWRTSWLSREGILAVATYVPVGIAGAAWLASLTGTSWWPVIAAIGALLTMMTVWSTGMIYASLPTIRAWHHPLVAPIYVVLALASGGLLLNLLLALTAGTSAVMLWLVLLTLLGGWLLKTAYWHAIDTQPRTYTAESATGLGRFGAVSPLDPPHTQANFVMREMGYQIARRHAERLRLITALALFLVPSLAIVVALGFPESLGPLALMIAVIAGAIGVVTERWLFFAEAQHVVTLYYGAAAA